MKEKDLYISVDSAGVEINIAVDKVKIPKTSFKDIPHDVLVAIGRYLVILGSIPITKEYKGKAFGVTAVLQSTSPQIIKDWIYETAEITSL